MVSTLRPLTFSILCPNRAPVLAEAEPPVSVIMLDRACSGNSEALTLTPFYNQESKYWNDNPVVNRISHYALSNVTFWKPLHELMPKLKSAKIPEKLKGVEQIDMNPLIQKLRDLESITEPTTWAWWKYALCGLAIIIVIVVLVGIGVLIIRYKLKLGACQVAQLSGGGGMKEMPRPQC